MDRYSVIADDLTGAGDTGVQFARAGLAARVVFGEWERSELSDVRVLVVNTDSRALPPDDAYRTVKTACETLLRLGFRPVYKKVDSTLRGRIGPELDAMLDSTGARLAVLCPAFPANGRIVAGGHLLVNGVPVERTPVGRDPVTPVTESYIPALLSGSMRHRVEAVGYRDLAAGPDRLAERLRAIAAEGPAAVACDAGTEADLEALVTAGLAADPTALFVGSAGLALPLARLLSSGSADEVSGTAKSAPLLALVGSVNPVTREQVRLLTAGGNWFRLPLGVSELLSDQDAWSRVETAAAEKASSEASRGMNLLMMSPGERQDIEKAMKLAAERGLDQGDAAKRIALRIASVASALMRKVRPSGVIATGGDTARALLEAIDATGLDLHDEVSPGIPIGSIPDGPFAGLRIVTKAGGFGPPEALASAARALAPAPGAA